MVETALVVGATVVGTAVVGTVVVTATVVLTGAAVVEAAVVARAVVVAAVVAGAAVIPPEAVVAALVVGPAWEVVGATGDSPVEIEPPSPQAASSSISVKITKKIPILEEDFIDLTNYFAGLTVFRPPLKIACDTPGWFQHNKKPG